MKVALRLGPNPQLAGRDVQVSYCGPPSASSAAERWGIVEVTRVPGLEMPLLCRPMACTTPPTNASRSFPYRL